VTNAGVGNLKISWVASSDESGGERDVIRYNITRTADFAPGVWTNVASIPAGGGPYSFTDSGLNTGVQYWYAVAAQDCTPAFSPATTTGGLKPTS
jgi:hypothetical protein